MYFGIKRKGVTEERARQEEKKAEEIHRVQEEVNKAGFKDVEIETRTRKELEEIKRTISSSVPSSDSKFRF